MFNFFDKAKTFGMRKMMERQMKNVPKEEQEKVMAAVERNPEFFEKIAAQIKTKMDAGMDQMSATMEVMQANREELQKIMSEN
jgi:alcohol dehydrogenase YqhD (iron-dependent ADH family)